MPGKVTSSLWKEDLRRKTLARHYSRDEYELTGSSTERTVYILPKALHKRAQDVGLVCADVAAEGFVKDKTAVTNILDGRPDSGPDVFVGVYPHGGLEEFGERGICAEEGSGSCIETTSALAPDTDQGNLRV
jgi:hypothetical protein